MFATHRRYRLGNKPHHQTRSIIQPSNTNAVIIARGPGPYGESHITPASVYLSEDSIDIKVNGYNLYITSDGIDIVDDNHRITSTTLADIISSNHK